MDLVLWFKKVYDENPDSAKNKLFWIEHDAVVSTGEWTKGTIVRIAENGFGTFQISADRSNLSILPAIVKSNTLKVGDIIEVRTKMDAAGSKLLIADLRKPDSSCS